MKSFIELRQLMLEASEGDARKYMKKVLISLRIRTRINSRLWTELVRANL